MPLYPLCISRSRDVLNASDDAIGPPIMRWSLAGELACAFVEAKEGGLKAVQHAAALEAIHRRIDVLPMRFGAAMDDESEIRSMLQERGGDLLDRLDRLDGACEMALRITLPDSTSVRNRHETPHHCNGGACGDASQESTLTYLEHRRAPIGSRMPTTRLPPSLSSDSYCGCKAPSATGAGCRLRRRAWCDLPFSSNETKGRRFAAGWRVLARSVRQRVGLSSDLGRRTALCERVSSSVPPSLWKMYPFTGR